MRRLLTCLILLAVVVFPVSGTTLRKKKLAQLATESEAIVVAKVIGNTCAWNSERTIIWTETTLHVLESWKGALRGRFAIKEPGGEVPPIGQIVHGMARYRPGDTVLVFMKKDILGQWRTHGCVQGAFRIVLKDGRQAPEIGKWTRHVVAGQVGKDADLPAFKAVVQQLITRGRGK